MNILYVLYIGFDRHGPSVHLLTDMIEQSLVAGHNVRMIVRNRGGADPDVPQRLQKYKSLQCDVIYDAPLEKGALVKRYFDDIMYAFKCRKIYRAYKDTDVVFLQSCTSPLFPLILLKRTLKAPVLFNVQNIFPIDARVLGKLPAHGFKGLAFEVFRWMQQKAYALSDRIVTISEDMKKTLIEEKVPADKIDVVYNWSYSDEAFIIPDDENLFLKAHNIDRSKFRVVFAGNLGAMVNAHVIAEAAKKCSSEKDIHFFIIGDGNNMPVLKRLAKEMKLSNISFYPYQPAEFAPHNYAMAHVNINALPKGIIYTCMPSKTATMLNCARPMVVSVEKDSAYGQLMSTVDKCTVVNVNDSTEFADAIIARYHDNCSVESLNAREVFKQMCSKEHAKEYVVSLEKLYFDVHKGV